MHRFYVPGRWGIGQRVPLDEKESHHALHVLRLRLGDPLRLLNGEGELAEAVVEKVEGRRATALVGRVQARTRPPLEITLVVGLSKPKAMDFIVQKATELGVDRMRFVVCARSVSRLDIHGCIEKAEKWRAAAIEALKQCGGFWLPRLEVFPAMGDCLDRGKIADLSWVAALTGQATHPRESLDQRTRELGGFPKSIDVWIGPEGDFTEEETGLLLSRGVRPISLGDNTLRSETAAIYCACALRYESTARGGIIG